MPVTLTPKVTAIAGVNTSVATLTAAADSTGFTFANDGRTILHIRNENTVVITLAATAVKKCSQNVLHSMSETLDILANAPANEQYFGPFNPEEFNDANGNITVALTLGAGSAANVKAEAIKIPESGR